MFLPSSIRTFRAWTTAMTMCVYIVHLGSAPKQRRGPLVPLSVIMVILEPVSHQYLWLPPPLGIQHGKIYLMDCNITQPSITCTYVNAQQKWYRAGNLSATVKHHIAELPMPAAVNYTSLFEEHMLLLEIITNK